jgi:hypothetical protein
MYNIDLYNIYLYSKLSVCVGFFKRLFFFNNHPIKFIFLLNDYLLYFIRWNKKFSNIYYFFYLLFFFFNNFFINSLKDNFYLRFKQYSFLDLKQSLSLYFLNFFKKKNLRVKGWVSILDLFYLIFISLKYKDSLFLVNSLYRCLKELSLFYYKRVFNYLFIIFNFLKNFFFFNLKISGLLFSIKGKIGIKGGLKKKKLLMRYKLTSFSNNKLRLDYSYLMVQTHIGVIGLKFFIFY